MSVSKLGLRSVKYWARFTPLNEYLLLSTCLSIKVDQQKEGVHVELAFLLTAPFTALKLSSMTCWLVCLLHFLPKNSRILQELPKIWKDPRIQLGGKCPCRQPSREGNEKLNSVLGPLTQPTAQRNHSRLAP